jgi:4-amino-4-deoxy-L-arabinose transferase-like glycosyltransferase
VHSLTPLASTIPAAPVLGLMALGVLVALAGHIVASRRVVALGLALLFAATLLMIVLGYAAYEGGENDPRPGSSPTTGNF